MTIVMFLWMQHMRKTTEKKTETRERILDAAGGLFRQHGVDAVGVDAVMRAAGLTHGGFYGHFPSKEALVGEVAAASLARAAARWERILEQEGPDGLGTIVRSYLDPAHVSEAERGCVLTTIGPDVSRRPEQRPAIGQSVRRMTAVLERGMAGRTDGGASEHGTDGPLAALATMVGAVMLARLTDDPGAAEAMLRAARHAVLGERDRGADALPDGKAPVGDGASREDEGLHQDASPGEPGKRQDAAPGEDTKRVAGRTA